MDSQESFDASTGVIAFSVKVAGRMVLCHVTPDWLRDNYGAHALDEGPMNAFVRQRPSIEASALRTWLASRGAEPVWLKREHVWRQRGAAGVEAPLA